ncbi:MAG: YiiX/YebB-like N1pC/P60 family cysteine hydrolase [Luteolibacter sp.]
MDSQPESPVPAIHAVLAAAAALPTRDQLADEIAWLDAACGRGYFLPDEDERVRMRYNQYLAVRAGLLETMHESARAAGADGQAWELRLPWFLVAFAAACMLMRANRFLVEIAADRAVVWKKLDEPDPAADLPAKSFTTIYRSISHPANALRFLHAADFYFSHKPEIEALAGDAQLAPIIAILGHEEPHIEKRRRAVLKRHLAYRWFSFLRRHRSAWRKTMFGLFELSGRAIAEMRQPGMSWRPHPKRIHPGLRDALMDNLRPGDVFVTRHDDAMSNWFLPGFWPHAALYLGEGKTLEAKKDGVRVRHIQETLHVDALVVLRPPVAEDRLQAIIVRALQHAGKPYDFLFDFRTADRLACTEVIYRTYHGMDGICFHLEEIGGRLCLPAEEFLDQALASGFHVLASGGVDGEDLLFGEAAIRAFERTRAATSGRLA